MPEHHTTIEARWTQTWAQRRCFLAPAQAPAGKFYNYDSGPFPNGELHMGHVRTYVLGDATARYQRLRGRSVLYGTEFDAFGLPNELAAIAAGCSPAEYTRSCITSMRRQLQTLGISYDWSRVPTTCEPGYYRWTQSLFLRLRRRGLVVRKPGHIRWCPRCETALARMQVIDDACWRCGAGVVTRRASQWYVRMGGYLPALRRRMDAMSGWSTRARRALQAMAQTSAASRGRASARVDDWLVSRQRAWGTPIPIVHCRRCGDVDVPEDHLPVELPESLDWSLGSRALADARRFVETACPQCGSSARRETDTLDCFFDDVWCFLACLMPLDRTDVFTAADRTGWLPVDRFHSGFDTMSYLHLHRFLGAFLHEEDCLHDPELIASYLGHDMVLAAGRKMSKHLGNVVSPQGILERDGADVLRVAMLWAAAPQRTVDWSDDMLDKARRFMSRARAVVARYAAAVSPETCAPQSEPLTRATAGLQRRAASCADRVGRFLEEYRPNAAIEALSVLLAEIDEFASSRLASRRLSGRDQAALAGVLRDFAVMLAPAAPFAAEEFWRLLGRGPVICLTQWPGPARTAAS